MWRRLHAPPLDADVYFGRAHNTRNREVSAKKPQGLACITGECKTEWQSVVEEWGIVEIRW